MMTQM